MIIAIIFAILLILILGLAYLGVKLAIKYNSNILLNEQLINQNKDDTIIIDKTQDINRIKSLLKAAKKEDETETADILGGYDYLAKDHKQKANNFRKEAKKIADKLNIKIIEE